KNNNNNNNNNNNICDNKNADSFEMNKKRLITKTSSTENKLKTINNNVIIQKKHNKLDKSDSMAIKKKNNGATKNDTYSIRKLTSLVDSIKLQKYNSPEDEGLKAQIDRVLFNENLKILTKNSYKKLSKSFGSFTNIKNNNKNNDRYNDKNKFETKNCNIIFPNFNENIKTKNIDVSTSEDSLINKNYDNIENGFNKNNKELSLINSLSSNNLCIKKINSIKKKNTYSRSNSTILFEQVDKDSCYDNDDNSQKKTNLEKKKSKEEVLKKQLSKQLSKISNISQVNKTEDVNEEVCEYKHDMSDDSNKLKIQNDDITNEQVRKIVKREEELEGLNFSGYIHMVLSTTNIITKKCTVLYNSETKELEIIRNDNIFGINIDSLKAQELPTKKKDTGIIRLVIS
ncbi:conserved protein, unknown function, partial [Hepatocystis sp. ex Piliocolobus tephrosceles]